MKRQLAASICDRESLPSTWPPSNDFLRFYIATIRLQLDAERPTVGSINSVAKSFFAGFTRITGTDTDEEERSGVYNVSLTSVLILVLQYKRLTYLSGYDGP